MKFHMPKTLHRYCVRDQFAGKVKCLIALAVNSLFGFEVEGIVSVGHEALLVGLHALGEDLEISLGEAAVTQGTQGQDALEQGVHLGNGVLDLAAQNAGHQLLELHDLAVGVMRVVVAAAYRRGTHLW